MLTHVILEVEREAPDDQICVQFHGECESDHRTFWTPGRALLEQVARICLDTRLDQIEERAKKAA
jgi:hypothetical protein